MSAKGLVRLWVVLTLIGVPIAAEIDFQQREKFWGNIDQQTIKLCVDEEYSLPNRPDALECGRSRGVEKTIFQREETTPLRYWSTTLGVFLVADLVLTALIVAAYFVARWVWRGFRPPA